MAICECMQESLAGSEVLNYFVYGTVMCVYVGQPLVIAASRNHPLLNSVTVLIDYVATLSEAAMARD